MPNSLFDNEKSVCIECDHKTRDKNHDDCVNCPKRVGFLKIKPMPDPTILHHIPETPPKPKRGRPPNKTKIPKIPTPAPLNKICSKCNIEKDFERDFHGNPTTPDGKHANCKACRNVSATKYRFKQQGVVVVSFVNYSDIYNKLSLMAKKNFRKVDDQIICIINEWMENNETI